MISEFFGRRRECRFYTAGCGNKMAVSVTGPRAVNELGGPVIPGRTDLAMCMISSVRRNGCRTVCSPWSLNRSSDQNCKMYVG